MYNLKYVALVYSKTSTEVAYTLFINYASPGLIHDFGAILNELRVHNLSTMLLQNAILQFALSFSECP